MTPKISIIGAGAVGATLAQRVLESGIADVALIDIVPNLARGKALDLLDAGPVVGHERIIVGSEDYAAIDKSDIVVITAGLARKPGMTREDLIAKNATIIREVAAQIVRYSPDAIVIIVTNPLDSMTYLALKTTKLSSKRVFGMAGVLDGSRFTAIVAQALKEPRSAIDTYVLGSHGDTMVALLSHTTVNGVPLAQLLSVDKIDALVKRTRDRGAEIVSCLGTGSAYYSPSASVFKMIDSIINDKKIIMPVSAYLQGEYGLTDICIGVPCMLGRYGIEGITEVSMTESERAEFAASAMAIRSSIESLPKS